MKSKQRLVGVLFPFTLELMKEQSREAFNLADNPDAEFDINQRVNDYINERISRMADSMNQTTQDKIKQTISEGIANGENTDKLSKRIQAIYNDATRVRSKLIARTETIAASNEASNEAYRQSPLVNYKEWHTEPDGCVYCQALNGKIIGLNDSFAPLGSSIDDDEGHGYNVGYESIYHPPLHPNCRCAILPVIK